LIESTPLHPESTVNVVNLSKTYRIGSVEYAALKDISVSIKHGEFVAVVGPSGCGKTTLLNLIGTLDRPTSGEIFLDGIPSSSLDSNGLASLRATKLGFVFQFFNLVPYLSAVENVILPLMASGAPGAGRFETAKRILTHLGLEGELRKKPDSLSGGEQQRVAIARALVNNPSIILADEPTGNLDTKTSENVVVLLKQISEERDVTVIMVTHNMDLTKHCHRVVYLRDGRLEKEVLKN
jgi:putative ABC transport system ATP-binding protein